MIQCITVCLQRGNAASLSTFFLLPSFSWQKTTWALACVSCRLWRESKQTSCLRVVSTARWHRRATLLSVNCAAFLCRLRPAADAFPPVSLFKRLAFPRGMVIPSAVKGNHLCAARHCVPRAKHRRWQRCRHLCLTIVPRPVGVLGGGAMGPEANSKVVVSLAMQWNQ